MKIVYTYSNHPNTIYIPLGISDECESCFYIARRRCVFPSMRNKHEVQSMRVIARKPK